MSRFGLLKPVTHADDTRGQQCCAGSTEKLHEQLNPEPQTVLPCHVGVYSVKGGSAAPVLPCVLQGLPLISSSRRAFCRYQRLMSRPKSSVSVQSPAT